MLTLAGTSLSYAIIIANAGHAHLHKVLEIQPSPSVGSQLHATQQKVLIIFRGQHLLLLPVLLGCNLLCLCFLTEESREMQED